MTKRESAIRNPQSAIVWAAFAALTILAYLAGLTMPLVGPDEPRYAQVAREMFERGDWITPTLGGFNWFEKPALLYWLQIGSYNVFGVSEFAARFGSAIFGLATVASLWLLGRHIENRDETGGRRGFANLLGLMGASTVGLIAFAHGASFDIVLTFPITAAMVGFFMYDSGRRPSALFVFYFFIGLALLAKGLIGIVFPFASVGLYYLLSWRLPGRRFVLSAVWGTGIAVAIASLWYVPMYLRHGYEFIDEFFIQHHFQRFTSNKYLHPQPFHFFFWVLPLMTIPWMPFFLIAVWRFVRHIGFGNTDRDSPDYRLRLFAFVWIVIPLVFFSFSGSKLPGYILPAVPAAIVLTADLVYRFIHRSVFRRRLVYMVAGGTLLGAIVAAFVIAPTFADGDSVRRLFRARGSEGTDNSPVYMLHGISHNAEFYAPGRIVREPDGKQKRFPGPGEIAEDMKSLSITRAVILVPLEYASQIERSGYFLSNVVGDNGEVVLVDVSLK